MNSKSSTDFFLSIDLGNTNSTCLLKSNDFTKRFSLEELDTYILNYKLNDQNTSCYLSSVKTDEVKLSLKYTNIKDLFLENKFLDMAIDYNESLGIDRILCAYYAYKEHRDTLVIDSGTFTTIDLVNKEGFAGGYILPGLELLQRSYLKGAQLHASSSELSNDYNKLPHSTEEAIKRGCAQSYIAPILNIISLNQSSNILITGGNGEKLKEVLKRSTAPIQYHADLIHMGSLKVHEEL